MPAGRKPHLVTTAHAAALLGLSIGHFARLRRNDPTIITPYSQKGSIIFFKKTDVETLARTRNSKPIRRERTTAATIA